MRKKWLIWFSAACLISLLLFVSACSAQKRPGPVQPAPNQTEPSTPVQPSQESVKADKIAKKVNQIKDVNSSTVVLSDTRAWVGIDLKANVGGNMTDQVKNEVSKVVKAEDRNIQTVYVTADADTVTRLKAIANDITAGKPVSGFISELENIGSRIMPSKK